MGQLNHTLLITASRIKTKIGTKIIAGVMVIGIAIGFSGCGSSQYEDSRQIAKAISISVDPTVWTANMKSLYPKMTEELQMKLREPPYYAQEGKRASSEEVYSIVSGDKVIVYMDVKIGVTNYTERYELTWDEKEEKVCNYAVQTLYPRSPVSLH